MGRAPKKAWLQAPNCYGVTSAFPCFLQNPGPPSHSNDARLAPSEALALITRALPKMLRRVLKDLPARPGRIGWGRVGKGGEGRKRSQEFAQVGLGEAGLQCLACRLPPGCPRRALPGGHLRLWCSLQAKTAKLFWLGKTRDGEGRRKRVSIDFVSAIDGCVENCALSLVRLEKPGGCFDFAFSTV